MGGRIYSVYNTMWAETTANSEDVYVQITVPAGVTVRILRVASNGSNGKNTSSSDLPIKLIMKICSTGATGTTLGTLTARQKNPYGPASLVTVQGKTSTGALSVPGTLDTLLQQVNYQGFTNFEWADFKSGGYIIPESKYFVVSLAENNASGNSRIVSVVWEEI